MKYEDLKAKVVEVIGLMNYHVLSDLFKGSEDLVIVKNMNDDTFFAFYDESGTVEAKSLGNQSEMEKFIGDAYGCEYSLSRFSKATSRPLHASANKKALETLKSSAL